MSTDGNLIPGSQPDPGLGTPAVAATGFVYLEAPVAWDAKVLAPYRLELVRHLKAGAVHGHLLRPVA